MTQIRRINTDFHKNLFNQCFLTSDNIRIVTKYIIQTQNQVFLY